MNIEIANRLVAMRKERGLSQEGLAERLGISRQAVSKWERAESAPDIANMVALAKLYQVSLDDLLNMDEEGLADERYASSRAEAEGAGEAPHVEAPADAPDGEEEYQRYRARRRRSLNAFPYPVICTVLYLLMGFVFGWWHPGWIIFITIPVYYAIVNSWG